MSNILAIVLAGGSRQELQPLVKKRAKAAIPVFGEYRIIDFVLSNLINSDIRKIHVMVQYKYNSLQKHIRDGWSSILAPSIGEYIDVYPPQQTYNNQWYIGTADAIYQNMFYIDKEKPDYILVIHGDHLYHYDYRKIIKEHIKSKADVTLATIPKTIGKACEFGNIVFNDKYEVTEFYEKPEKPHPIKQADNHVWINAGVYVFSTNVLKDELITDAKSDTQHNISRNIIPKIIGKRKLKVHFCKNDDDTFVNWNYFLDLKEYYNLNLSILKSKNEYGIELYNDNWPIRTYIEHSIPAKIYNIDSNKSLIYNSIIGSSSIIKGRIENSIIGSNVYIEKNAVIKDSIILPNTKIGNNAYIEKAILDKHITINNDVKISPSVQNELFYKIDGDITAIEDYITI